MMHAKNLVPMAFVANVARSIKFYSSLGFGVGNTFTPPGADAPAWAWLQSGEAQIMVAQASHPVVPDQQAVLFYIYTEDVAAAHPALSAQGLEPGPITTAFYAPGGEFRLIDPDGYVLMVTHL